MCWKSDSLGQLTWDLKLITLRRFGYRVENLGNMIIDFCIKDSYESLGHIEDYNGLNNWRANVHIPIEKICECIMFIVKGAL